METADGTTSLNHDQVLDISFEDLVIQNNLMADTKVQQQPSQEQGKSCRSIFPVDRSMMPEPLPEDTPCHVNGR